MTKGYGKKSIMTDRESEQIEHDKIKQKPKLPKDTYLPHRRIECVSTVACLRVAYTVPTFIESDGQENACCTGGYSGGLNTENEKIKTGREKNNMQYRVARAFPKQFLLGTATSAFQVEGTWDEGKSPSMWDDHYHNIGAKKTNKYYLDMPSSLYDQYKAKGGQPRLVDEYKGMPVHEISATKIIDESYSDYNGDVAADAYHKTDTDVALLKELGVNIYRFSICPIRIVPGIHGNARGQEGLDYYNRLIDKLIENGITPVVPKTNIFGGHLHPYTEKLFEAYARLCFNTFGDRVKLWTTVADLQVIAEGFDYIALKTMLIAAAEIWKAYNLEFKEKQKGECSITIEGSWFYPEDPTDPEHQRIAELARLSTFGMVAHALANGEYPPECRRSLKTNKRVKVCEPENDYYIPRHVGSYDIIVFNYYNSEKVRPLTADEMANESNRKRRDRGYFMSFNNTTPAETYEGFLNCLKYIDQVLNHPKIFIGENGFPEDEGCDNSVQKIAYHKGILNKLLEAIDQNINVFGKKHGIYAVDFDDESRPRTKKKSFSFFQKLFKTKILEIEN
ncbi:Glycoside hydrolase family 1,Glycoside hydrolase superfamily [Cinara cedri]|uniref:Glycoside hydrolase family 1,Glycoside hydrolase superfamily n=1 Tax=Cinara cedri TaxID=506608 RepID=A0A5E4NID1_9HEMI|nr:Glycoside hydrolase family 1,Glycoside hydrolase superfamily [Cinara cedri]